MRVAIVDYGSGNLRSVAKAFERVAASSAAVEIAAAPDRLAEASHIVLPGVGSFGDCMRGLKAVPGMLAALQHEVLQRRTPLLGICVGMQMLFERGHEHGVHAGLGWLKGEVVPMQGSEGRVHRAGKSKVSLNPLKIPHMGWNELRLEKKHPLLAGLSDGDHAYFVHSYYAHCQDAADLLASVDYGGSRAAIVGRGTIMGTQFHPEKSQETGLKLLKNFLEIGASFLVPSAV